MANVIATQNLVDGPRRGVFKVDLTVDTSDLASTTVWDPAARYIGPPPSTPTTGCYIERIDYSIGPGLSINLLWDAGTPVSIIHLTGSEDIAPLGGLKNNATSPTGKIQLTTKGWAASAVLSGTLVVYIVKTVL